MVVLIDWESIGLKNWLKKVQNYYDGVRYVMGNNLKFSPSIDEDFLKELVDFYNKLFFCWQSNFMVLYWVLL